MGFWNKLFNSDVFIFLEGVKYDHSYPYRRCWVDGSWAGVAIPHHQRNFMFKDVSYMPGEPERLAHLIRKRLFCQKKYPFYERLIPVLDLLEKYDDPKCNLGKLCRSTTQWVISYCLGYPENVVLIKDDIVRDNMPPTTKLLQVLRAVAPNEDGSHVYLSGEAGKEYLIPEKFMYWGRVSFQNRNMDVPYNSNPKASILDIVAREKDPRKYIWNSSSWS
jgi:hypothetical protein